MKIRTEFHEMPEGGWVVLQTNTQPPHDRRQSWNVYLTETEAKSSFVNGRVRWEKWQ